MSALEQLQCPCGHVGNDVVAIAPNGPLCRRCYFGIPVDADSSRPSFSVIEGEGANVEANLSSAEPFEDLSAEVVALTNASGSPKSGVPSSLASSSASSSSLSHGEDAEAEDAEVDRLLRMHAAGEIAPVEFSLPDLPENATEPMRRVADFYRLVRGVLLWAGDERPVLCSSRWVGRHTNLPRQTANRALEALADAGVLERCEPLGRTHTYLPGGAS